MQCESRLLDPADDEHVYLELHLHCVRLRNNGFGWVVSLDTTEADTCPGCGATHGVQRITATALTVDAAMCTACGMHWATTTVNPALSILGLLPTPQLRTAALMATLRTEVTRRSGKEQHHDRDSLPARNRGDQH